MWTQPLQAMWAVWGLKYLFQFAPCSVALQRPRAVQEPLLYRVHPALVAALPGPEELQFSLPTPFLPAEVSGTCSKP